MFPNDDIRPRRTSIDGFVSPRPTTQHPSVSNTISAPKPGFYRPEAAPQILPETQTQQPKKSFARRFLGHVGMAFAMILLVAAGPLIQLPGIGQVLVAIYGICAIFFKIESRTTFIMALIALAVVLVASVRSDVLLAGTFGLYAFLLLTIGTVSLLRELRSEI